MTEDIKKFIYSVIKAWSQSIFIENEQNLGFDTIISFRLGFSFLCVCIWFYIPVDTDPKLF